MSVFHNLSPKTKLVAMFPAIVAITVAYTIFLALLVIGANELWKVGILYGQRLELVKTMLTLAGWTIPMVASSGVLLWGYWGRDWIRDIRGEPQ